VNFVLFRYITGPKRQETELKAHRERLEQQRIELAKKQASEDKAREHERYVSAGGDPANFEEDYPEIRRLLIAPLRIARHGHG
jgi:hypothetical protein